MYNAAAPNILGLEPLKALIWPWLHAIAQEKWRWVVHGSSSSVLCASSAGVLWQNCHPQCVLTAANIHWHIKMSH